MKNYFTLIAALMFSVVIVKSQTSGGPDTYGYVWHDSNDSLGQAYNWIDITGLSGATQVQGLVDDNSVGPFPIGFPFHFYWYDVTQFWVGSNGYLGFTNGQLSAPFATIPSAGNPQNFVAGFATDLIFDPTNPAVCWKWTNAANDTLIVSFIDVPFYDPSGPLGTGSNTFQIILSGVDSSITYQYKLQSGTSNTSVNSVIGIENNSGSIGLQHSKDVYPPANYSIKYTYPKSTSYSVSDASTVYNDNIETAGLFLTKGSQFTMKTEVRNSGNQPLGTFDVISKIQNNALVDLVKDTATTGALTPGQTQSFTMNKTWTNSAVGTYKFITETKLTGDATPSNNIKTQELVVVDTTAVNVLLSYDSGFDVGNGGLSWTGGSGGGAVYFVPPFYPCKVKELLAYIVTNTNSGGYNMMVFDDNGGNGTPGTRLDSIFVDPSTITTLAWNSSKLATPIRIDSGGVYVLWEMKGVGISLGQNATPPFSNRCFEYINNSFSPYRYSEIEDLMININIASLYVGVNENEADNYFGNFYPNPTSTLATINYDLPNAGSKISYNVYDLHGRIVVKTVENLPSQNGRINIDVQSLKSGIYTCKILVDEQVVVRKLVVTK